MKLYLDDVKNVRELIDSSREAIIAFGEYSFILSCNFVCEAIPGTTEYFVEDFTSTILPISEGGLNSLQIQILNLAKKLKEEDLCDFVVNAVTKISITFKKSDRLVLFYYI